MLHDKMSIKPKLIYVEDDDEWRREVSDYIKTYGRVEFDEFICASNLEDVEVELQTATGRVALIMDLRLGGEHDPNYGGYRWLLEDLESFLRRNASTLIFVISGQLHEGIRDTLRHKGIPDHHIFDKGEWADERAQFVHVLRQELYDIDHIAFNHISRDLAGQNIDPYLVHMFYLTEGNTILPMLVQARSTSWHFKDGRGLQLLGQIGVYFCCLGDEGALVALERDPEVLAVEASRPSLRPVALSGISKDREPDVLDTRRGEGGEAAAVGLVGAVDVLHPLFRNAEGTQSRILAIWDQTDPTGPAPAPGFPGTLYGQEEIQRYLVANEIPAGLARHVGSQEATSASVAAAVAPDSKIVVVIPASDLFSSATENGNSGLGYAVSHLTAIEFIRKTAKVSDLPVTIQVFQGMTGGPHDDTSLVEKAFNAAVSDGHEPGIVLIAPAGDERRNGGHARLRMVGQQIEVLPWEVAKKCGRCVLELWFAATDHYSFAVITPDGRSSELVRWLDKRTFGGLLNGNTYAISYTRVDRQNGDSRLLVTLDAGSAEAVQVGEWQIEIRGADVTNGVVHAWLERTEQDGLHFADHISDECTLVVPATARHVVTVGSLQTTSPRRASRFSSKGPTRDGREKPDTATTGEGIHSHETDFKSVSFGGSCTAAARVTGTVALVLSAHAKEGEHLCVDDIKRTMPRGNWHESMGFGVWDDRELIDSPKAVPASTDQDQG